MNTNDSPPVAPDRRPLDTRKQSWVPRLARALDAKGFSPNGISALGIVAALIGACAFFASREVGGSAPRCALLLLAALMIQTRLLANMMDGLVAVECGRGSPDGDFFNEVPDRLEDAMLLIGAGFAAGNTGLGTFAALIAVSVAYLRAYRASRGLGQDFRGPGAKPHRMFVLTLGTLVAAVAAGMGELPADRGEYLRMALIAVIVLGVVTLYRRGSKTLRDMRTAK